MGSMFGSKQPAPPPPPPPATLRDEVSGVEQVPVTNPDGTVTYVTRRIPLSPEQQAQKDELNKILQESLAEIQRLSSGDYADDEDTKRILAQWGEAQARLLDKQAGVRESAEEQALARRGISDSSAAQEVRRQRQLDQQEAQRNLQLQKDEMSNQVRGERLSLQQNLYNIAAGATDAQTARVYQAAMQGQGNVAAINAQRQASLLDYYRAGLSRNSGGLFGNALLGNLGRGLGASIGTAVGGPVGGYIGGSIGSMLGNR